MKASLDSGDEDNRNLHIWFARPDRRLGTCAPICNNNQYINRSQMISGFVMFIERLYIWLLPRIDQKSNMGD